MFQTTKFAAAICRNTRVQKDLIELNSKQNDPSFDPIQL